MAAIGDAEIIATEKEKLLEEIIEQARISHKWMLATIKKREDDLGRGYYSDELTHAIEVQKLLETF